MTKETKQFIDSVMYELVDEDNAKVELSNQLSALLEGKTGQELKDYIEELESEVADNKVMNYIYRLYTDYVCNKLGF